MITQIKLAYKINDV